MDRETLDAQERQPFSSGVGASFCHALSWPWLLCGQLVGLPQFLSLFSVKQNQTNALTFSNVTK
jgi:hypothetical protein